MSDYDQLKRLAQRVIDIESEESEPIGGAWDEFEAAANPAVVLGLITELTQVKSVNFYLAATLDAAKGEIERLKAEVAQMLKLPTQWTEVYEQVAELEAAHEEVDQLKAECEGLRAMPRCIANEYSQLLLSPSLSKSKAEKFQQRMNAAMEIDRAMGKGEQS